MKLGKKLAGLLIAMVMTLALVPTAAAAEIAETCRVYFDMGVALIDVEGGGTVTPEFKGYKLLNLSISKKAGDHTAEGHTCDKSCYNYAYTFNSKYETILRTAAGLSATADVDAFMSYLSGKGDKALQAFANTVYEAILADSSITSADTTVNSDGPFGSTDVTQGYWLFVDTTSYTGENYAKSLYLLDTKGNDQTMVQPKRTLPTVEKKVSDDNTTFGDKTDVNVGDTVYFKLTGTLDEYVAAYDTYRYVFHDTLSKGLTLNKTSIKVYVVNGTTKTDVTENFTVSAQDTSGKFTVGCADILSISGVTINANTTIVVEYSATLNGDTVLGSVGNPNSVQLEYTNAYDSDSTGKTTTDTVKVYTFGLDVTKVDRANESVKLSGAKFKLYRMNGTDKEWATVTSGVLANWTATEASATELESDADGKFTVKGLDAGTYYLKETVAPTGYNLLKNDIQIVIAAGYESDALETLTIAVDSGTASEGVVSTGMVSMTVKNSTGTELPSTGGVGTTVFYVLGSIMVLAAGVLLVTRKRMSGR